MSPRPVPICMARVPRKTSSARYTTYVTTKRSTMSVMTWLSGRRAKRWSSPSGIGAPSLAEGFVQDERLADGEDVVDAQNRGAALHRGEAGGDGAAEALVGAGAAPPVALGDL